MVLAFGPVRRASAAALPPPTRAEVAAHFAPTLFQETRDQRDLLAAFDFDGDWDLSNNAAHVDGRPLPAVVYYAVVETATHWFITYLPYHPVDAKRPTGHDNDTEHATLVVRRGGTRFGRPEVMETRFHNVLYQYAAPGAEVGDRADNVDGPIHFDGEGRPEIYVQRVGHGLCGGFSPPFFLDTLSLSCHHAETPHLARRGIVYRFTGHADAPGPIEGPVAIQTVGYALIDLGQTFWPHLREIGPQKVFATRMDYRGERCGEFSCPSGIGAVLASAAGHDSTGMPWEEGSGRGVAHPGDTFFDPAYTLSRRLRFPMPYALDYTFNPYLGIGAFDRAPPSLPPQKSPVVAGVAER